VFANLTTHGVRRACQSAVVASTSMAYGHSGLTWSTATSATVADLTRRAGHASPTAALRYQTRHRRLRPSAGRSVFIVSASRKSFEPCGDLAQMIAGTKLAA
jgi:hypothetical protein